MLKSIDLNCDLGESYGNYKQDLDRAIMPYISSCNIACGFHSGDPVTISKTIDLALEHEVAIGAHPSYPDLQGFGRRIMHLTPEELEACVLYQVSALKSMVESKGGILHHVKPHGALYNHAIHDEETALGIVKALVKVQEGMLVYAPDQSVMARVALNAGLRVANEAFADRMYEDDYSLRSRKLEGAVIYDRNEVLKQITLLLNSKIQTYSGAEIPIEADTICLHSDTKGAADLAQAINTFLEEHEVDIAPA